MTDVKKKLALEYEFIDPDVQIASDDFKIVESFLAAINHTQIGWHYITDLTWIYRQAKHWPQECTILDAGGGYGPAQFLLAEMGFNVVNVDLMLETPAAAYQHRYGIQVRRLQSFVPTPYTNLRSSAWKIFFKKRSVCSLWGRLKLPPQRYVRASNQWRRQSGLQLKTVGRIEWITGNLSFMPEIDSESFDAVVSLSALEHIPANLFKNALEEIQRVLKKDAHWAITTSGTEKPSSWFHEPSQGWCFSTKDIQRHFNAQPKRDQDPETVLIKYRWCTYLQEHLASSYKLSGANGMPWGIWKPKYMPVGISNTKVSYA